MIHPIFKLALRRPSLVVDHLGNYAALVRESMLDIGQGVLHKAIAWAVVAVCVLLAVVFAGVSVLLGVFAHRFHWILVVVPAIPFAAALVAWALASRGALRKEMDDIAAQIQADKLALDAVKEF